MRKARFSDTSTVCRMRNCTRACVLPSPCKVWAILAQSHLFRAAAGVEAVVVTSFAWKH